MPPKLRSKKNSSSTGERKPEKPVKGTKVVRRRNLHSNDDKPDDRSDSSVKEEKLSDVGSSGENNSSCSNDESALSSNANTSKSSLQQETSREEIDASKDNISIHKETKKPLCSIKCFAALIVLLAAGASLLSRCNYDLNEVISYIFVPAKQNINRYEQFIIDLKKIKADFSEQDKRLWKIAKTTLGNHIGVTHHKEPVVLMLASNQDAYATSQCLARRLSKAFSHNCTNSVGTKVNGASLSGVDADRAKLELDKMIGNGFQSGSCSAMIFRFDSIPSYATTTFYQYCENDNAPFKDVAVIFTVQVEDGSWNKRKFNLDSLPVKDWDHVVDEYLTQSLKNRDPQRMTDEMVSALLSRISPSVVWVRKEKQLSHC